MNRDSIEGRWKQFKGKKKAQWGKHIGHQLEVIDGKRVEESGKIQEGYGFIRDATEQQIEPLKKRNND